MTGWHPRVNRLDGKHVVVLAEVPVLDEPPRAVPSSPVLEAEEAVMSLVRAVIAEGGMVTVVGDPSLGLLAGIVAGEYALPDLGEEGERPRARLSIVARVSSEDTEPTQGEGVEDPFARLADLGHAMVTRVRQPREVLGELSKRAHALVCVGTNSAADVSAFRAGNSMPPVFVMGATGSRADRLVGEQDVEAVETIDHTVEREAPLPVASTDDLFGEPEPETPLPPVALSAQRIVERLIDRMDPPAELT